MSKRDRYHYVVKEALRKDGWEVKDDPLTVRGGGVEASIDLGAEKLIAASRGKQLIAVEVKSFLSSSAISEFHTALGQYLNYRKLLNLSEPERKLYLAVPDQTYRDFFSLEFPRETILEYQIKVIVYNPKRVVITQWIN